MRDTTACILSWFALHGVAGFRGQPPLCTNSFADDVFSKVTINQYGEVPSHSIQLVASCLRTGLAQAWILPRAQSVAILNNCTIWTCGCADTAVVLRSGTSRYCPSATNKAVPNQNRNPVLSLYRPTIMRMRL